MFGCKAYAHVKLGKLDTRAVKCLFIGYPEGVKGYKLRCLEPGMERTLISRDVTFVEDEFPMKLHVHQSPTTDSCIDPSNPLIGVELPTDSSSARKETILVDTLRNIDNDIIISSSTINLQEIDRRGA